MAKNDAASKAAKAAGFGSKFSEVLGLEVLSKSIIELVKDIMTDSAKKVGEEAPRADLLDVIDELPDETARKNLLRRINEARSPSARKRLNIRYPEDAVIKAMCKKLKLIDFYNKLDMGISGYDALVRSLVRMGNKSEKEFWEEIDGLVHNPFSSMIYDNLLAEDALSPEEIDKLRRMTAGMNQIFAIDKKVKFSDNPWKWFIQYFQGY